MVRGGTQFYFFIFDRMKTLPPSLLPPCPHRWPSTRALRGNSREDQEWSSNRRSLLFSSLLFFSSFELSLVYNFFSHLHLLIFIFSCPTSSSANLMLRALNEISQTSSTWKRRRTRSCLLLLLHLHLLPIRASLCVFGLSANST